MKASEEPKVGEELYHIRLKRGDLPRYALLPGDPGRVKRIASKWLDSKVLADNREYLTYVGTFKDTRISSTSTGIGSGATAIALEELLRIGVDTFIRTGTTGALRKEIKVGDIIISSGAVRGDGATRAYIMDSYPAVASFEIVLASIEAAESLGVKYHVGLTYSTDSFYLGQSRPGFRGYMSEYAKKTLGELTEANVINMEMESSTLFTVSNIYGARAGGMFAVIANRVTGDFDHDAGIDDMINVANETVHILEGWDLLKDKKHKSYFYPSIYHSV